ncbi:hypothetical protein Hanom_Chr01g00001321 [Helianthus anomalus]
MLYIILKIKLLFIVLRTLDMLAKFPPLCGGDFVSVYLFCYDIDILATLDKTIKKKKSRLFL